MGNKIESIKDIKDNTKGFVFGSLPSFPSDPASGQWKPGCKAYDWCKNDIQRLEGGGVKYWTKFLDKKEKLTGVYIIGKREFFEQEFKKEVIRKEAFDLIIPKLTSKKIMYSGKSGNLLSRLGDMTGDIEKHATAFSPHPVWRWRREEKVELNDLWCLLLITDNKKLAGKTEQYLHGENKRVYGHSHMLWEYTNNKTEKGFDRYGTKRYLSKCTEIEDPMEALEAVKNVSLDVEQAMNIILQRMIDGFPDLSKRS